MSILKTASTLVTREVDIFLGFSWRDWSATIIPGSIFAVGAMRSTSLPLPSIISKYVLLISWLTAYIYFFDLSNQITGVDEDRINKPDRPIPSGKVTMEAAQRRWAIALSAFIIIAVFEPTILPETMCWVITVAFVSLTSAGNHWFGKNCVAMVAHPWALLSASWKVIATATPTSERHVLAVAVWFGLLAQIQDLRDWEGDAAAGRKTMQVVFGDGPTRWIITLFLMPVALWVLWMGNILHIAPVTLSVVHVFLAYRILQAGGPRYDHKTYMMWTYTFCMILAFISGKGLELDVTGILSNLAEQTM